ncbi:MAG: cold-shock DNA-binding domain [Ramlibacter sp.]|nr:cold-shock DNA-binding domain [Ramlibacter sp.]
MRFDGKLSSWNDERGLPGCTSRRPAAWTLPRLLVLPAFVAVYLFVASRWPVSSWVAVAYLVASVAAFVAYAVDKSAARNGGWRTSEATLHGFSLACGWPGALLAQQLLRHKTAKPSFVASFWLTVGVNVAGFLFLHSPVGSRLLA